MHDPSTLHSFLREWGSSIAGLVGAVVSLSFWDKVTLVVALGALSCGAVTAYFATPIVVHYIDPPEGIRESVSGITGLLFGVTGFLLLAGVHAAVRRVKDDLPAMLPDIIKRYLERKAGG